MKNIACTVLISIGAFLMIAGMVEIVIGDWIGFFGFIAGGVAVYAGVSGLDG